MRWRSVGALALVAAVTFALSSSAGATRANARAPQGTLTFGMGGIPSSGDPYQFLAPPGLFLYRAVFDGLTQLSPDMNVSAALATSWKNPTPSKWVFTLRKGVKFQDGEPFNATAVRFTYTYLLNHTSEPTSSEVANVKAVRALGPYTVEIDTKTPDALMLRKAAAVFIVAPKAFQTEGKDFATKPVGTGNFKVTEWVPSDHITLQATPSWRPAPHVKTVVFRQIPDPATRLQALKSGQINVMQGVSPDDISGLRSAGYTVEVVPRAQVQQITFETTTNNGPWQKKQVRLAMNMAIDRAAIVKTVLGGTTQQASGQIVGPGAFGFNPAIKPYPYDPAQARQLLAQAGYPNGFSVTMQATVGNFPNDKQAYEAVASYLAKVGIKVNFQIITLSDWLKRFYGGPRAPLWVEGLQYLPEMDSSKALNWYRCTQPPAASHFCHRQLDRLLARASTQLNETRRQALLEEANKVFHADAPAIPLWQLTDIWALKGGITGWVKRPDAVLPLDTLTLG